MASDSVRETEHPLLNKDSDHKKNSPGHGKIKRSSMLTHAYVTKKSSAQGVVNTTVIVLHTKELAKLKQAGAGLEDFWFLLCLHLAALFIQFFALMFTTAIAVRRKEEVADEELAEGNKKAKKRDKRNKCINRLNCWILYLSMIGLFVDIVIMGLS